MASIYNKLFSVLSGDSGVSALVSARIYPSIREQETELPAITYSVSSSPTDCKDGSSVLEVQSVQINCFATTVLGADTLRETVRTALDGYSDGDIQTSKFEGSSGEYDLDIRGFQFIDRYEIYLKR